MSKYLEIEGFPHCLGHTIARADDEVLIEEDLKNYLLNRYAKELIPSGMRFSDPIISNWFTNL
jgi:type I restriction enzyme R subunit